MTNHPHTTKRWYPARSDPPSISSIEAKFREVLALEYAAGWPFYNQETRTRLGDEAVRLNIDVFLRALKKSGLRLTEVSE